MAVIKNMFLKHSIYCRISNKFQSDKMHQKWATQTFLRLGSFGNPFSDASSLLVIDNVWRLTNSSVIPEICVASQLSTFSSSTCKQHTHKHNHFTALWNLSGTTRLSRYQKKQSPTHTHRGHQSALTAFSIYYDPWHPPFSIHMLYGLFTQSLSKFSLVYLLAWYPPLHTPYMQTATVNNSYNS